MKQQITIDQWNELTKEQKYIFRNNNKTMSINQMKDFLGNEWNEVYLIQVFGAYNLCDKLWYLVKHKLNSKH